MNSKKSFTLIELLVVISIIAILASLVLISLRALKNKVRNVRIGLDLIQVWNIAEMIYNDQGKYDGLCMSIGGQVSVLNIFHPEYGEKLKKINEDVTAMGGGYVICLIYKNKLCISSLIGEDTFSSCVDNNGLHERSICTSPFEPKCQSY